MNSILSGTHHAPARQDNRYQSEGIREVKARAATFRQELSENDLRNVKRLSRVLDQGQPIEQNVPRGYYLNIRV